MKRGLSKQQIARFTEVCGASGEKFSLSEIRLRQIAALMRIIITCDAAQMEAAANHAPMPEAFLAIRNWAGDGIDEIAERIEAIADPKREALARAQSVRLAAEERLRSGNGNAEEVRAAIEAERLAGAAWEASEKRKVAATLSDAG